MCTNFKKRFEISKKCLRQFVNSVDNFKKEKKQKRKEQAMNVMWKM